MSWKEEVRSAEHVLTPWVRVGECVESGMEAAREGDHDAAMHYLALATRYVWICHARIANAKSDADACCGVEQATEEDA